MDPASIVGLVSATASLVVLTARVAKDIHTILDKYKNVATKLQDIEKECIMLGAGFKRIQRWLDNNKHRAGEMGEEIGDLNICLGFFSDSLAAFATEISEILAKPGFGQTKISKKERARFLWNEDIMQLHLDEVRSKRDALHFLLSSFQL
jgi:hypothetical protein